ncbi:hypothetical protein [Halobacillus seohaensis]|uniref:hypothetical protein n=1 Tax=Halobacillus seohaensis TaxID=447421 RepID=UPI0036F2D063
MPVKLLAIPRFLTTYLSGSIDIQISHTLTVTVERHDSDKNIRQGAVGKVETPGATEHRS